MKPSMFVTPAEKLEQNPNPSIKLGIVLAWQAFW